jgi:hypothetical protein
MQEMNKVYIEAKKILYDERIETIRKNEMNFWLKVIIILMFQILKSVMRKKKNY